MNNHYYTTTDGTSAYPGPPSVTEQLSREDYERELKKRQEEHLRSVFQQQDRFWRPCLHDGCPECHGTGVKLNGGACVHMISCPCPKCSPMC